MLLREMMVVVVVVMGVEAIEGSSLASSSSHHGTREAPATPVLSCGSLRRVRSARHSVSAAPSASNGLKSLTSRTTEPTVSVHGKLL